MTRNFVSVDPSASIFDVAKIMSKKHVGSVIIKENQVLKGILTEGDIIEAIAKSNDIKKTSISKIMTKKIVTIMPSKDVYDALITMKKMRIRWLPVVIDKNVIGFLTEKDILKIQPDLFDIVIQRVNIAEEDEKKHRITSDDDYKWAKEGPCQECGAYDLLYALGDKFVCLNCRRNLG
jgi:CBS domain-containing protein